jgi:hypothetical protein
MHSGLPAMQVTRTEPSGAILPTLAPARERNYSAPDRINLGVLILSDIIHSI